MPSAPKLPSVHALEPLESGGPAARVGFAYQDYIAADFCVEMMLTHGTLAAVWCEVLDDITLIWTEGSQERIEFVQVKSNQSDTPWTPADICGREGGKVGTSILEKSLNQARCRELSRFRLVTVCGVKKDLSILTLPFEAAERQPGLQAMVDLSSSIAARLSGVKAKGSSSVDFWLQSVFWDVRGAQSDVENATIRRLGRYLYEIFKISAPDHVEAVHDLMLRIVWNAGRARKPKPLAERKVLFDRLLSEVRKKANELLHPRAATGGSPLRQALVRIGLPEIDVQNILLQQNAFRSNQRRASYLKIKDQELAAKKIEDALHSLRLQYVAGAFQDNPLQFHLRCLRKLEKLHEGIAPDIRPPIGHFVGVMYDLVDRKVHSFHQDGS